MRTWLLWIFMLALAILQIIHLTGADSDRNLLATVDAQQKYVRYMELEVAELKGRLEVFEKLHINIDLTDHSGIWFVSNTDFREGK